MPSIKRCRICGNQELISLLNLGVMGLTGIFPKSRTTKITQGPLELVKCHGRSGKRVCNLVQLNFSFDKKKLYGKQYGYRSGLNTSMVSHLKDIVLKAESKVDLLPGDLVLDIGSNDGTLLNSYPANLNLVLLGMDPTGKKFKKYYRKGIDLVADFFSAKQVKKYFGEKKAKIITSIAMFYDLDDPVDFAVQIRDVLADDGIWVLEQSYLPLMLQANAYDTICHEHLEYYGFEQINWIMETAGLKIIDISINDINGGSSQVIAAKKTSTIKSNSRSRTRIEKLEKKMRLDSLAPYRSFEKNIKQHRVQLISLINKLNNSGYRVFGYGASTKGNVMLQYCGFSTKEIPYIAEVNEDKFNAFTPKTRIPIISEAEAKKMNPDFFLVLPWHFRENILKREKKFLNKGGKLIFPLPEIEIVGKYN